MIFIEGRENILIFLLKPALIIQQQSKKYKTSHFFFYNHLFQFKFSLMLGLSGQVIKIKKYKITRREMLGSRQSLDEKTLKHDINTLLSRFN